MVEKYTNSEIIGDDDYGVAHGTPNDAAKHPITQMPPRRVETLGFVPKGINKDYGDE
jgi:hypothetical protein